MARIRITYFILVLSIFSFIIADTSKDIKKLKKGVKKLKKKDISILFGIDSLKLKDEEFNETLESLSIETEALKMDINQLKQEDLKFNETLKSVISAETDFMKVARSLFGLICRIQCHRV
jgi:FtsZ-binding cell division protein ZapB